MLLERYLIDSDPYRSTSLPDAWAWPFPLRLDRAPDLQLRIAPLQDDIRRVLDAHDFPTDISFAPYVATKPHYPGGDVPANLLSVILGSHHHTPSRLGPAKDELLDLLRRNGVEMHVDIVNVDFCFRPSLFVISPDHPVVMAYENAKHALIDILNQSLESRWRVVCPFNVGRVKAKALPSIAVMVEPFSHANWFQLGSQIAGETMKYMSRGHVDVEFIPGDLSTMQTSAVSFLDKLNPDDGSVPKLGIRLASPETTMPGQWVDT